MKYREWRTKATENRKAHLYASQTPHSRRLTFDIERQGKWLYVTMAVFVWVVSGSFYFKSWKDCDRSRYGA